MLLSFTAVCTFLRAVVGDGRDLRTFLDEPLRVREDLRVAIYTRRMRAICWYLV